MKPPLKAGVMGWPVDHSRSPALHEYWLKTYDIDGSYLRLPIPPEKLALALGELHDKGFNGVNLTVPHKEAALTMVDVLSPEAKRIGAINTVFVAANGRLYGTNTDGYGFISNVRAGAPALRLQNSVVTVLGAGGAARAVCVALQDEGVAEIRVVNRTIARAENLAQTLGSPLKALPWTDYAAAFEDTDLLVNTTTLGMAGQPPLDMDLQALPTSAVVNDIVYVPLETPLLAAARARGNPVVDGLGMLLYQAQPGFAGWFGVRPEVTPALRRHVLAGAG